MCTVTSNTLLHTTQPILFTAPNEVSGSPDDPGDRTHNGQKKIIQTLKLPPRPIAKVCEHFTHLYIGERWPSGESL
jgi:hypothetical protein